MSMSTSKRKEIIDALIIEIQNNNQSPVATIADRFEVSRQTVNRYLKKLLEQGLIKMSGGQTRKQYSMNNNTKSWFFPIEGLEEDVIWFDYVKPLLPQTLSRNILEACSYGFTEMLNNAIDHSESEHVAVILKQEESNIVFGIHDDGIGIFDKVQRSLNLSDPRHAILELTKGKFTTDPSRHSGEGIFFTSRIFDDFSIVSGNLIFMSGRKRNWDILFDDEEKVDGTWITMKIATNSDVVVKEIQDRFSTDDSFGFSKTQIPVKLMQHEGQMLVSRSQAKRLIARFDRFSEVILDFDGVEEVGQAFADELFRVFVMAHPDVHVSTRNVNENVYQMIRRAQNQK